LSFVQLMAWLEGSALGHVMRDSGVWFYGIINLAHILGVATLFGSVVILDLRLLGFWPDAPLAAIRALPRVWRRRDSALPRSLAQVCSRPRRRNMLAIRFSTSRFRPLDWPAQRVPRSPLIRLARAQEPRPDVCGAPTPRRHGRHLVVLLADLNWRRP
jgi:hypothetical protein